jgi:replicative DNA helicase
MDNYLEKPLPSNDDAERIVVGAPLIDEKLFDLAKDRLVPTDFYNPFHKRTYEAMLGLNEEGIPIDPIAISEWCKRHNLSGWEQSLTRVTSLVNGLPLIKEADYNSHVKTVKKHAVSRKLLFLTNQIQRDILEGEEDIEDIAKNVETSLAIMNNQMVGMVGDKTHHTLIEIRNPMLEQFAKYNRGEFTGVRSGMKELDEKLDGGGFQGKGTYVLGGGEKSGKTSLALRWIYEAARIQGVRVPYVTMEMSAVTLTKRLYSQHTGIPYYMFRPGFSGPLYEKAIEEIDEFSKIPITIADSIYGMAQIKHFLRRMVEMGHRTGPPVGMAVIDYLQIINLDTVKAQSREREVTAISRELKQLSTELDIPLIVMSNLNRMGLTEGQEPDTFNLRDSGSIAFDAEAVMFLHNPAYVPGKPYESQEVTDINLIISRQRNGPTGRIKLKLIGKYMQFMTATEFDRTFGPSSDDKPELKSKGQMMLEQQKIEDVWDEEEDEDDGWPNE